jgi:hypothetical protein
MLSTQTSTPSLRRRRLLPALALVLAFFAVSASAPAQVITGQIDGTVRDPSGAAVPNVTVFIKNTDTNQVVRTLKTSKTGEYSATLLQVGTYEVTVDAPGFKQAELVNIVLNVGDQLSKDIHIVPGASAEVSVTADEQRPDIENNSNASIVDNTEIKELALSTRNFEQMLLLQPGVSYGGPDEIDTGQISPSGARNSHQLSINGLQPNQVMFLIDGADMLNHTTNTQASIFPTIDAIQQIKVERNNYGAQYGGGGSAQVSIVTKAGATTFHGGAYYFVRNQAFDATPVFDLLSGLPKPSDRYNDYGYDIGGPLFIPRLYPRDKSKSFFFFSQEFKRLGQSTQNSEANFPTLAQTYGYFTTDAGGAAPVTNSPFPGYNFAICVQTSKPVPAGIVLPSCLATEPKADPVAQEYLDDVFRPSVESVPSEINRPAESQVIFQQESSTSETQELLRLDNQFSERLSGFFRYIHDPITQQIPNAIYKGTGYPGVANTLVNSFGDDYLAHLTWTVRPNTVAEFGFSYLPAQIQATPTGAAVAANSPDVHVNTPFPNMTGRIPDITLVAGFYGAVGPFTDRFVTTQGFENTTQTLGRHTLYFGVNYEHLTDKANPGTTNAGEFTFLTPAAGGVSQFDNSFASLILGKASSFQQASVDPHAQPHQDLYEAYIQDNWKATATLTLNAGVRYSIFAAPGDYSPNTGSFPNGKLGAFQPEAYNPALAPTIGIDGNICTSAASNTCTGLVINANALTLNGVVGGGAPTASPYGHAVSRTPYLNFAPRVGFAWNVYGDAKTALRGGFGIFYEQQPLSTFQNLVYANPAYVQNPAYPNPPSFLNPGAVPAGVLPVGVIGGISRAWTQPYVESWNLDVQQQIGKDDIVDVGYVGNNTMHLQGEDDLNQPLVDTYIADDTTGKYNNAQAPKNCTAPTALKPNASNCCTPYLTPGGNCYPGSSYANNVLVNGTVTSLNTETQINRIRPYQGWGPINYTSTRFFADYNGLQTSLIHRAGKLATIGVSYTFSKAMANSAGAANPDGGGTAKQYDPQYRYDLRPEWAVTTLDRRNIFVAHAILEIPSHGNLHGIRGVLANGWELSTIDQMVSGLGVTAFQNAADPGGVGISATGTDITGRPDLNANPNHGLHTQLNWFKHDVGAVGTTNSTWTNVPTQGTEGGSEPVGAIIGPGFLIYNLDIFKTFELPENLRLQFRAEGYNFINHVNWNNVDTQTGNVSQFGTITSAYDNRKFQFGLKLSF